MLGYILNYSAIVQPPEGISEAYSHLGAHNKALICRHAVVATPSPSSRKSHANITCFLYF